MLVTLVLTAGAVGVAYQHAQREVARVGENNIEGLKGQVKAAYDAQTENTKVFTKQFSELSKELGDFKTELTTKELRDKIRSLQSRLEKALDPPRAKLIFSFDPMKVVSIGPSQTTSEAITKKTLPIGADGSFHVDFTVANPTDVDAIDGELVLQICDGCKFAKEPPEFKRLPGQDDRQRHKTFARIHSMVQLYTLSAAI